MRICLVLPPSNFIAQGYGVTQKVKFGHLPPLGIGYIAAYLEQDGHQVSLVDATSMEMDVETAANAVLATKPELVGLSVLTNYADHAKALADRLKELAPDLTIVLGGAHTASFYQEILTDMPSVDHVLRGESDTSVCEYVRHLRDPERLHQVKGLVYRDADGKTVVNPPAAIVEDMDQIPMPAWHLYDMSIYRPLPMQFKQAPVFTMMTGRGCAWARCKFCFQSDRVGPSFRRHSVKRVLDEMEILVNRYGIKEVHFWDDIFVLNKKWVEEFAAEKKRRGLGHVTWVGSTQANTAKPGMIRTLREAGGWSLFVGVESGNQELLNGMDKGITLDMVRRVMAECHEVGMETRCAFMLGLPGETPEMGRKTIEFAVEIDPTYAIFYAAHPRRGTELYDIALTQGLFVDREYRGMSRVTYVPEGYSGPEELSKMIQFAYRRFYLRPYYYYRTIRKIRSYRDAQELFMAVFLYIGLSNLFAPLTRLGQSLKRRLLPQQLRGRVFGDGGQ
ncbi:putative enzyme [Magnetospirillum sp. LM-5]|uniref:B12-binding domain-containing radical SAM protein n=1 Tax=Magnetospirillum sp. LM-5 TaxID=2681466 RepID=UPI00138308F3|nr:radical SAM protein [Magnetospirillum sp. LM-5]CAA7619081.1 putative enzyme [Magnetospirillum sp. LM-5]